MEKDCKSVWSECLDIIRERISPKIFQTWFAPIQAVSLTDNVLVLLLQSHYVFEYLEGYHMELLKTAIRQVIGPKAKLEYSIVVDSKLKPTDIPASDEQARGKTNRMREGGYIPDSLRTKQRHVEIDPRLNASYTFSRFIEGSCNRLAKAAAAAIAKKPGETAFNPLLIYGGTGLGKTHLAHAIGWEVKNQFPEKVVLYVTTNEFQTQFTEARLKNEINDFMHFYKNIDVLILDDIQDLAGKQGTQNTFFYIFNYLQQSGKQLVLTSDRAPVDLEGMEERLLSRFRWGLSAEIKAPDFDTRLEIARLFARKEGIDFSEDVLQTICKYINNNVRELEGAILSLLARATFIHKDLTVELVQETLGKIVKDKTPEITVDHIQKIVCQHFHISPEILQSKTRKREVVQTRQLAMYLCKKYTNASLSTIGMQLGKKDHTTVLYAIKAVEDLIETDRNFRGQVEDIQKKLYARN